MKHSLKFGFDVVMEKGVMPRPVAVRAWNSPEQITKAGPQAPFKYFADALCGLSLQRMHPSMNCPIVGTKADKEFSEKAWQALDPHAMLWERSRPRVEALHADSAKVSAKTCAEFEKLFNEALNHACKADGVNLNDLWPLIDAINYLESRKNSPLLYNFGLHFSPEFTTRLHAFFSFLFHLRSIVAVDWNAHVDDASHEAVRVDSITDYVPKAEYVVNDALLYWQFRKLAKPFTSGKNSDVKVEKLFVEPLLRSFRTASHNACYLIDHLPQAFLEGMGPADLEEALYHVQMDWLLGSEAGLLFRIREELFGLQNGYEKIFWHEVAGGASKKAFHLSLCFELTDAHLRGASRAA